MQDTTIRLHSETTSIVVRIANGGVAIVYWGPRLAAETTDEMLMQLATRSEADGDVERESAITLLPTQGAGFSGQPGLAVHRSRTAWGVYLEPIDATAEESSLAVKMQCAGTQIQVEHRFELHSDSDMLVVSASLTNIGGTPLSVQHCAALTLPFSRQLDQVTTFGGRWSLEFQRQTTPRRLGAIVNENRAGRTSHGSLPALVLHDAATNETDGIAIGLHLGWSGNHQIRVDELPDGRCYAQLGELLLPGEIALGPGESYESPRVYGTLSRRGFNGLAQRFHRFVRDELTDDRVKGKLKKVHFNTWEALYFDTRPATINPLIELAANIGIERFVLDDGWFRGRDDDTRALGDWFVDQQKFPEGLAPIIDKVHAAGMEFGLWVEPEMINPDSDLYRAHPEWVLHSDPAPRFMMRHQMVLNLTLPAVQDYLFDCIDALLNEYSIAYLKWDMNRNLEQPGGRDGIAVVHEQVLAVYALMQRVRAAHPQVEIESCASGGARADYGVLANTDRIWTSDSNDALDRLAIQRGFSQFFPAEVMGAHVGPRECHITGRNLSMAFRAGVAMFGDMGVEADLRELTADELTILSAAIEVHKQHRALIFAGDLIRLNTEDHENAFMIASASREQALISFATLSSRPRGAPGRLHIPGLAANRRYTLAPIWPAESSHDTDGVLAAVSGQTFTGEALACAGMQLPFMSPGSLLVLSLRAHP